jgi:hypothetical protein
MWYLKTSRTGCPNIGWWGLFFFTGEAAWRAGAVKSNWQWAVDVG